MVKLFVLKMIFRAAACFFMDALGNKWKLKRRNSKCLSYTAQKL